ncbi:hypothetical protein SVI_2853 [Shewanella violacea DSS12]|uniref:Uncharacterized protein n=1 Tax=Shewanella violacea (strain JCM 10179 / CIP 106290 / LMG 19151 / DSS12) TaxID=637905 RepID=D4ZMC5_SHEVD|nr:hypothetical protein SVI_2853 [Shewanella violacea DSS12]
MLNHSGINLFVGSTFPFNGPFWGDWYMLIIYNVTITGPTESQCYSQVKGAVYFNF